MTCRLDDRMGLYRYIPPGILVRTILLGLMMTPTNRDRESETASCDMSLVNLIEDLSTTLTTHLRLMARDEESGRTVDTIENALSDFITHYSPDPHLSRETGKPRIGATSTKPMKQKTPASAADKEWERRISSPRTTSRRASFSKSVMVDAVQEVQHIVQDDEENDAITTPVKAPRKLWRRTKSLMAFTLPPRNNVSTQKVDGAMAHTTTSDIENVEAIDGVDSPEDALVTNPSTRSRSLWTKVKALGTILSLLKQPEVQVDTKVEKDSRVHWEDEIPRDESPRYMWEEDKTPRPDPESNDFLFDSDLDPTDPDAVKVVDSRTYIVDPNNNLKASWDLFVGVAVLYVAMSLPIRLAFDVEATGFAQVFDILLDAVFILDIMLNFVTGYTDPQTKDVVLDSRAIASRYASSWLLVDLVSSVPTEVVSLFSNDGLGGSNIGLLKLVKLFKLFRMFRLLRLRWFADLEMSGVANPNLIRMMKFLGAFGMCLHFTACCYWAVAVHEGFGEDVWVPTEYIGYEVGLTDQYSAAIYFAIAGMLGNHMNPHTPGQMRVTAIIMFLGLVVNATIIGSASSLLSNLNAVAVEKKKQMDGVQQYLSYRQVPRSLKKRIARYFEYFWDCGQNSHNDTLLEDLPRSLSLRLRLALSRMLIERVPLFRSLESNAVLALVLHMDSSIAIPEEVILREGDFGDTMYFINRGSVNVHKLCPKRLKKISIAVLNVGSYFGEIALLDRHQERTATVTAQTYCELYALTQEHWEEAIQKYPQLSETISRIAKNRLHHQRRVVRRAMDLPDLPATSSSIRPTSAPPKAPLLGDGGGDGSSPGSGPGSGSGASPPLAEVDPIRVSVPRRVSVYPTESSSGEGGAVLQDPGTVAPAPEAAAAIADPSSSANASASAVGSSVPPPASGLASVPDAASASGASDPTSASPSISAPPRSWSKLRGARAGGGGFVSAAASAAAAKKSATAKKAVTVRTSGGAFAAAAATAAAAKAVSARAKGSSGQSTIERARAQLSSGPSPSHRVYHDAMAAVEAAEALENQGGGGGGADQHMQDFRRGFRRRSNLGHGSRDNSFVGSAGMSRHSSREQVNGGGGGGVGGGMGRGGRDDSTSGMLAGRLQHPPSVRFNGGGNSPVQPVPMVGGTSIRRMSGNGSGSLDGDTVVVTAAPSTSSQPPVAHSPVPPSMSAKRRNEKLPPLLDPRMPPAGGGPPPPTND